MIKQFIGDNEVIGIVEIDRKTPSGAAMISVMYEGGIAEEMPQRRFDLLKTEKKTDASAVIKIIRKHLASLFYGTMMEFGTKHGEINGIMEDFASLVDCATEKATNILYGVEYPDQRNMLDINDIILKFNENNTNGAASAGSGADTADTK